MAESRYKRFVAGVERLLLKGMVYGSLAFDPKALNPDIVSEEPSDMVKARFKALSREEKRAFFEYFQSAPSFPIQIYRKSNCPDKGWRNYKIHYEYDRPDRRSECRRLVLAGFDLSKLKNEYYTFAQLHELRRAHESGLDITPLLDNRYSRFQYKVLTAAMRTGYDMDKFLDPSLSARDMAAIYYDTYEQNLLRDLENEGIKKQFEAIESMDKDTRKPALEQTLSQADTRREEAHQGKVVDFSTLQTKKSLCEERR